MKGFKAGFFSFCITLCILGTIGGLIAVNEISLGLRRGGKQTAVAENKESQNRFVWYLPPQYQVLLSIPKWQSKCWEYYFTVLKTP